MDYKELLELGKSRRTTKAYNNSKKIKKENLEKIFEFAHTAPHTLGLDLVRIINFSKDSIYRQEINDRQLSFNKERSTQASDIAVIITKTGDYVTKDNKELIEARRKVVKYSLESQGKEFIDDENLLIRTVIEGDWALNGNNKEEWLARQSYIVLAYLLLGAKSLGIESTPVEGFSEDLTNYLRKKNLIENNERATIVVYLGYSDGIENAYLGKKQLRKDISEFIEFK